MRMRAKYVVMLLWAATLTMTAARGGFAFPWRPDRLPSLPDLSEPGMAGNRCNTCHTQGGGTPRNPFGREWERTYPLAQDMALTAAQAFAPLAASDSDGDGFTNAQELGVGTHPGNATSKPVQFTRRLDAGVNTLAVPVRPGEGFRALDLLALIGDRATALIRWDADARSFMPVQEGGMNPLVSGQSAFIVTMAQPMTVRFVGRAWPDSEIEFRSGLNYVALPRAPVLALRLSDLLDASGFGIAFDEVDRRFVAHLADSLPTASTNAPLRGGRGYFVFSTTARRFSFVGSGWSD